MRHQLPRLERLELPILASHEAFTESIKRTNFLEDPTTSAEPNIDLRILIFTIQYQLDPSQLRVLTMYRQLLLVLGITAAATASKCTFVIDNSMNLNAFGGGGRTCQAMIIEGNDPNAKAAAMGDMTCTAGCTDLEYKGQTYTFCTDGLLHEVDIASQGTVQRQPDGVSVNIFPDGEDKKYGDATAVDQYDEHIYWRTNIECP
ncbi:hypothetical protein PHISCL_04818 [Aspergillus sclerotialis]|uniref:Uncharacterized protein n=1 Tax=Aspergillus sclerotialis TaxID=2070753 RepID=A0A3A2ZI97_9EURO|nr:hypothetical protein PHISCL_04818 [Aspergillus sclerotialis]